MGKSTQKQPLSRWKRLMLKLFTVQCLQFIMLATHAAAILLSLNAELFPGEEALKSIVSSFAEILAGLYGVTMAGYTFFLSRIDGLTASDATLDFVVVNVKNRFKRLIYFITGHVSTTLTISLVLMYVSMPQGVLWQILYRLFCNEFVLNTIFSISLILYYSILVIDPNCLEKEARKQKEKLSPSIGTLGNPADFISLYAGIVQQCHARLPGDVLEQIHTSKGNRFPYSIELLGELQPELEPLLGEIRRVHQYYSCMVNCSPMTVTQEMCLIAQGILTRLEAPMETAATNPEMP